MPLTLYYTLLHHGNLHISRYFCTSNILNSHYDVLNLPRTCTSKEIKESYIKLSKENHPDVNKNKDAHRKILQINEAYKVLSKRESRQLYDLTLTPLEGSSKGREFKVPYNRERTRVDPWKDSMFYANRNKDDDKKYEGEPYYGIKGIKRVSNITVVIVCLTITVIVVGLQVFAIRNSVTFQRDELIRKSKLAEESHRHVREMAALNGNEMQLEILKRKLTNTVNYKRERKID